MRQTVTVFSALLIVCQLQTLLLHFSVDMCIYDVLLPEIYPGKSPFLKILRKNEVEVLAELAGKIKNSVEWNFNSKETHTDVVLRHQDCINGRI